MTAEKNPVQTIGKQDNDDGYLTLETVVSKSTGDYKFLEAAAIQRDKNLNTPLWRIILENLELIKPI